MKALKNPSQSSNLTARFTCCPFGLVELFCLVTWQLCHCFYARWHDLCWNI